MTRVPYFLRQLRLAAHIDAVGAVRRHVCGPLATARLTRAHCSLLFFSSGFDAGRRSRAVPATDLDRRFQSLQRLWRSLAWLVFTPLEPLSPSPFPLGGGITQRNCRDNDSLSLVRMSGECCVRRGRRAAAWPAPTVHGYAAFTTTCSIRKGSASTQIGSSRIATATW